MDSIRGQPKQVVYQDLSPLTEHTETIDSHVLRVHLPDFRAEDVKIRLDHNSMKLLVRCRKPLAQTTIARVELDLDVPKDADVGHIRGNFEQGWLSLFMPKKRITQDTDRKEEEEIPKEKAGSGERKKEEQLISKEKAESGETKKKEEPMPKEKAESGERKKKEEPMPKEEQKKIKEEDMPKETDLLKEKIEKDKTEEKTKEGSLPEDKPTVGADNSEQERKKQSDKAKSKKDTTEEAAPSMNGEKPKACRKRERREGKWEGANWKNKIEVIEEWLDGGLVDKLTKSFENNKKLIYAAAVGFSVGFLVSQKLRSRST
ncbi:uncharacterized protein LOC141838671 [Curcuma longa]|uniref:uncharacterized protein LOC141838671 n=1 Tax=Curcuma longa TaxID=136217 RepID=UPI003D9E1613